MEDKNPILDYIRSKSQALKNADDATIINKLRGNPDAVDKIYQSIHEENAKDYDFNEYKSALISKYGDPFSEPVKKNDSSQSLESTSTTSGSPLPVGQPTSPEIAAPFAGGIPSPVGPAQEQNYLEFRQKEDSFPVKSADELVQQVVDQREGRRVDKQKKEKAKSWFGQALDNAKGVGKYLTPDWIEEGLPVLGATSTKLVGDILDTPELLRKTITGVVTDVATSDLRKKYEAGEITKAEFISQKKATEASVDAIQSSLAKINPASIAGLEDALDEYANVDEFAQAQRDNYEKVHSKITNADKDFATLFKQGNYSGAFKKAGTEAIGSLPYMLTAAGGGIAGLAAIGGATAVDKYAQLEKEAPEETKNTTLLLNSFITGALEGITESVSGSIGSSVAKMVVRGGTEFAKKSIIQSLRLIAQKTLGNALEEGASEALNQLGENIVDKYTVDPNKNLSEGVLDAAIIGAVSGGGVTAVGSTAAAGVNLASPNNTEATAQVQEAAPIEQAQEVAPSVQDASPIEQAPETGTPNVSEQPTEASPIESEQPTTTEATTPTEKVQEAAPISDPVVEQATNEINATLGETKPTVEEANKLVDDYLADETRFPRDKDGNVLPDKQAQYEQVFLNADAIAQNLAGESIQQPNIGQQQDVVNQPKGTPLTFTEPTTVTADNVEQLKADNPKYAETINEAHNVSEALAPLGISVVLTNDVYTSIPNAPKGATSAFVPSANGKGGKIVLNPNTVNSTRDLNHESVHAVLQYAVGNDPKVLSTIAQALRPLIKGAGRDAAYIERYVNNYVPEKQAGEFLAELGAAVADGFKIPQKNVLRGVENVINNVIKKITGSDKIKLRLTSDSDAIDFFNRVAQGVKNKDIKQIESAKELATSSDFLSGKKGIFATSKKQQEAVAAIVKHHEEVGVRKEAPTPTQYKMDKVSALSIAGKRVEVLTKGNHLSDKDKIASTFDPNPAALVGTIQNILSVAKQIKDRALTKETLFKAKLAHLLGTRSVSKEKVLSIVRTLDDVFIEADGTVSSSGIVSYILSTDGATPTVEGIKPFTALLELFGTDFKTLENGLKNIDADVASVNQFSTFNNLRSKLNKIFPEANYSPLLSLVGLGKIPRAKAANLEASLFDISSKPSLGKSTFEGFASFIDPFSEKVKVLAKYLNESEPLMKNIIQALTLNVPNNKETLLELYNALIDGQAEFASQVEALTNEDGAEVLYSLRSLMLGADKIKDNPKYNDAKSFVRKNHNEMADKDIVMALMNDYGYGESSALALFEKMTGRKFKDPNAPMGHAHSAIRGMFQNLGKMLGDPSDENLRDSAYSIDYKGGNLLAFVRKFQRDTAKANNVEGAIAVPYNAYDALQTHLSASLYEIDQLVKKFVGYKNDDASKKASLIGRWAKQGISVNDANDFLIQAHRPEHIARKLDLAEQALQKLNPENSSEEDINKLEAYVNKLKAELQDAYRAQNEYLVKITGSKSGTTISLTGPDIHPEVQKHLDFYREVKDLLFTPYLDALLESGKITDEQYLHLSSGTSTKSSVAWYFYVPSMYDEDAYAFEYEISPVEQEVERIGIKGLTETKSKSQKKADDYFDLKSKDANLTTFDLRRPLEVAFHRYAVAVKYKHSNEAIQSLAKLVAGFANRKDMLVYSDRVMPKKNALGETVGYVSMVPQKILDQSLAFTEPGGKKKYIYFSNPNDRILNGIKTSGNNELVSRGFVNAYRLVNNVYRGLLTTYNPAFMVGNLLRDFADAVVNINVENVMSNSSMKDVTGTFLKNYGRASKFLLSGGLLNDPQMAAYFEENQRMGGTMGFGYDSAEILSNKEKGIQNMIFDAEKAASGRGVVGHITRVPSKLADYLGKAAQTTEDMARLTAYATMRELGADPLTAAGVSKNITINFEKKGRILKDLPLLNLFYLFLNTGIQGSRKSLKILGTARGRKALAMYAAASAATRIILLTTPAFLASLAGDDEDEVKNNLEAYIYSEQMRKTKTLLPNAFDPANPIQISRPQGILGTVGIMTDNLVDLTYGKRTAGDVAADLVDSMTKTFDPIGGGSTQLSAYLPFTIAQPLYQVGFDRDWLGREIVFGPDAPLHYKVANRKTPQIYTNFAKGMYMYSAGAIDMSPSSYEYLFKSYIGGIGPVRTFNNLNESVHSFVDSYKNGLPTATRDFMVDIASANRVIYNRRFNEDQKQVLYNFMQLSERKFSRGFTNDQLGYVEKAVGLLREKEILNDTRINAALEGIKSQLLILGDTANADRVESLMSESHKRREAEKEQYDGLTRAQYLKKKREE